MAQKRCDGPTALRHAKQMRLGKKSFVSQAGISSLCDAVERDGLPQACSRGTQQRARKTVCNTMTPYGRLVERERVVLTDGTEMTLAFQNPLAILHYLVEHSDDYCTVVTRALAKKPCSPASPWNLTLYQDGIDPSDGLAKHHTRKAAAFYWSFLEYGMQALSHEETWGTPTVARMNVINKLPGVHVQLTHLILKRFFDPDGHNIQRAGVTLTLKHGGVVRIFAKWGVLIADEPAIKEVLSCKGHAGSKPCVLCCNVVLQKQPAGATPLHTVSDYAVSIANVDFSLVKPHSNSSLRHLVRTLHEYKLTMSNADFELREQLFGFTYNTYQLLLNESLNLDVISITMFDWAHCMVADGIADAEMGRCMKYLFSHHSHTTYSECGSYICAWKFPKGTDRIDHLFERNTIKNNLRKEDFSCGASEFLTIAPVLARYFRYIGLPRGEHLPQLTSMVAVLAVLELLQAVKRGFVTPAMLRDAIQAHFIAFVVAYGADAVRPKHHYVRHFPDILARVGTLISTLMHERKHRVVLRYLRPRCNTVSYEVGVMEDVTCHYIWDATQPFLCLDSSASPRREALHILREMYPNVTGCEFALHASVSVQHGHASHGDMVFLVHNGARHVAQLQVNFSVRGERRSIVTLWLAARSTDDAYANFVASEHRENVATSALELALTVWFSADGRKCTVCMPFGFRNRGA